MTDIDLLALYDQYQYYCTNMTAKILLTSFDTWLPHQKSNSSDDLLAKISQIQSLPNSLTFLRKLPVDFQEAPNLAIAEINQIQPESRQKLSVESCACCETDILKTAVNLEPLVADLVATEISHEAGKYVCEALYYAVLKHICDARLGAKCIFVHVPILNDENIDNIVADFLLIMRRLTTWD
jgi:pyroglutamyl-peptidase